MYYYLPLFLTFLNLLITLVLFYYAFYLFKKEQKIAEKNKLSVIRYEEALEKATKKATSILEHTDIISADVKKSFEGAVDKVSESIIKNTDDYLKRVLIDQELMLQKTTADLTKKYYASFDTILQNLDKKYLQNQKDLDKAVDEKLKTILQSIDDYRDKKNKELDETVKAEVDLIVKKILPKYISIENQEEMVLEVVKKARDSGFFNFNK